MKLALAADHKGVELKGRVKALLMASGHEVIDFGPHTEEPVDYPDFGLKAARAVATKEVDRAITICWTGNGMNMAANKVRGVRAGLALNPEMAQLTRLHNDANVLTL
ncbi:MAG: RpiB/LacA/LacB family sugar-phosphate isomerase, partial [bacterium]|nr:RpiB/LacA/LacB family sugar-phosphate isomerase [bacterium]